MLLWEGKRGIQERFFCYERPHEDNAKFSNEHGAGAAVTCAQRAAEQTPSTWRGLPPLAFVSRKRGARRQQARARFTDKGY